MTEGLTPLDTLDALGLTEEALFSLLEYRLRPQYSTLAVARAIRALASPPPPHEAFRELP